MAEFILEKTNTTLQQAAFICDVQYGHAVMLNRYIKGGPTIAQIVITFHLDRENNRQCYIALLQNRAHWFMINILWHVPTYANNEWGRLYNVHIRSKSNRNSIAVHNLIRMYVILSNRAVRSWQIVSPEKCLLWPSISKSSTNSTRTSASTRNSWSSMINYELCELWCL